VSAQQPLERVDVAGALVDSIKLVAVEHAIRIAFSEKNAAPAQRAVLAG
jgi:hypothetical protein